MLFHVALVAVANRLLWCFAVLNSLLPHLDPVVMVNRVVFCVTVLYGMLLHVARLALLNRLRIHHAVLNRLRQVTEGVQD